MITISLLPSATSGKLVQAHWIKRVLEEGDGKTFPKAGDKIVMDYTGTISDGTVFDDSRAAGRTPLEGIIGVGHYIKGWDEAVLKMSLGERCELEIKPEYAYGRKGYPPVIPPDSVLKFDMKLLNITPS